jgi:dihydrolipoamide dehydrogenase
MPSEPYDVVLLGGGTGGYVAAIRAAQLGMKVAVVENDKLGGTCLHRGCVPTKALLKSASVLTLVNNAKEFGVTAGDVKADYSQAVKRSGKIVNQHFKGTQFLFRKNGVDLIEGTGKLKDSRTVHVDLNDGGTDEVKATKAVVINTGSSPRAISGVEFDGKVVVNSDHTTWSDKLPKKVIIRGGGATGVEFASIYHEFGCEVTLVGRVVPNEDHEISQHLTRTFTKEGIRIIPDYRPTADDIKVNKSGVKMRIAPEGKDEETLEADMLMVATGREGNIHGIGLEDVGVETEGGFIKTDEFCHTNVDGVYAIGDINGKMQLAHTAMHWGVIAMEKIAGENPRPLNLLQVPLCTYCHPEIGSIGLSEKAAKEAGHNVKVGKFPLRANSKAMIEGEGDGFIKMVADADNDDLLGVHMIGGHATELIAEAALATLLEATPWEIGLSVHPHPTISEVMGEAALAVDDVAIHI